jgi:hypothetical protein
MLALFLCLLSLAYGDAPIKRKKESFEVKSPAVGDTIALAKSRYGEFFLNISWIAPQPPLWLHSRLASMSPTRALALVLFARFVYPPQLMNPMACT